MQKKKRICSDTNHEIEHNIKTKNFLVFNDHVQLVNVATCIFINDVMIQDTLNKLVQKINTKKVFLGIFSHRKVVFMVNGIVLIINIF